MSHHYILLSTSHSTSRARLLAFSEWFINLCALAISLTDSFFSRRLIVASASCVLTSQSVSVRQYERTIDRPVAHSSRDALTAVVFSVHYLRSDVRHERVRWISARYHLIKPAMSREFADASRRYDARVGSERVDFVLHTVRIVMQCDVHNYTRVAVLSSPVHYSLANRPPLNSPVTLRSANKRFSRKHAG